MCRSFICVCYVVVYLHSYLIFKNKKLTYKVLDIIMSLTSEMSLYIIPSFLLLNSVLPVPNVSPYVMAHMSFVPILPHYLFSFSHGLLSSFLGFTYIYATVLFPGKHPKDSTSYRKDIWPLLLLLY